MTPPPPYAPAAASATIAATGSTSTATTPTRVGQLAAGTRSGGGSSTHQGGVSTLPVAPAPMRCPPLARLAGPEQDLLFGHHCAGLFGYSHLCGGCRRSLPRTSAAAAAFGA